MLKMKDEKMVQKIIVTAVLLVGLFFVGTNQTMSQTSTIAGEWDAAMNTPGGVRNFKIVFTVDGEKVTGMVKRSTGDVALTGTIKGSDLQFAYSVNYNDNDLVITMTGKVDGDSIKGAVNFGGAADDEWSAKRAVAAKP